jgi:integrase
LLISKGRLARSSVYQYTCAGLRYLAFCRGDAALAREPDSLRATARRRELPASVDGEFHLVEVCSKSAMRTRMKRARNRLTPEEVWRICRAPNASTLIGLRDRALLLCLATTGCRVGEVVSLRQSHIRREVSGWWWRRGAKGKVPSAWRRLAFCG